MALTKNTVTGILAAAAFAFSFAACNSAGKNDPGDQYTWDMVNSRAYEPYYLNPVMADSMGALLPAQGTIPYVADSTMRDIMLPYEIPNTTEGYELAGQTVKSPLDQKNPDVLAQGKHFFEIYCTPCHGFGGDGQGSIVASGAYTAHPPSYYAAGYIDMPDGKMFHSVTYGKGAMQSYAQQVNKLERWEIIAYINSMQDQYVAEHGMPAATTTMVSDTVKTKVAAEVTTKKGG